MFQKDTPDFESLSRQNTLVENSVFEVFVVFLMKTSDKKCQDLLFYDMGKNMQSVHYVTMPFRLTFSIVSIARTHAVALKSPRQAKMSDRVKTPEDEPQRANAREDERKRTKTSKDETTSEASRDFALRHSSSLGVARCSASIEDEQRRAKTSDSNHEWEVKAESTSTLTPLSDQVSQVCYGAFLGLGLVWSKAKSDTRHFCERLQRAKMQTAQRHETGQCHSSQNYKLDRSMSQFQQCQQFQKAPKFQKIQKFQQGPGQRSGVAGSGGSSIGYM